MKYLYSVVITILFTFLPSGMYILARELFKFEQANSVNEVMERIKLINLGIHLIIFLLIILFLVKKEIVKRNYFHGGYKKLFFALILVYLTRIIIAPILFLENNEDQVSATDNISLSLLVLNFLNFVILPPINEELVFRGYILRKFINSKRELIIGMIFSSILFASIHLNLIEFNFRSIIYTFILGLVFGFIYIRFGIIASIVSHAFINFMFYAQKYLSVNLNVVEYFETGFVYWMIVAIASIILIVLFSKGLSNLQVKSDT